MPLPDPFTTAYDRVFSALEAHAGLTDLVRPGNRFTVAGPAPLPLKESLQAADTPTFTLMPTEGLVDIHGSSSSIHAQEVLVLEVVSGDLRLQVSHYPIKWEVVRALVIADQNGTLTGDFIQNVNVGAFTDNLEDDELTKGLQGWSGSLAITIELWIDKKLAL